MDTASVRVTADTSRGERDARKAGENFGKEFTKGADGKLRDERGRFVKAGQDSGEDFGRGFEGGAERENRRRPPKLKIDPLLADFQRQVRSEVASIIKTVNAEVPLTMKGEKLRAQVAVAVNEIERTIKAEIPTDPAGALEYRRKLALLVHEASRSVRSKVDVDIDVDRNGLRRVAGSFTDLVNTGTGLFARLGASISSTASQGVSVFSSMAGPVGTVVKLLFALQAGIPAVATGFTVLGGGAIAAFGAVAAAAIGLPALISSIAAPIAAISIGMDGIKAAAAPLSDEIKHLTDVLNITFELNMRPVFEKLQAIFPTLSVGLAETARAVSRVAMDLTGVVTSEAGIENLRVAFAGVSNMIDHSREGLTNLFSALLNVAGTRELYAILGDTIGGVAARFGNMIERVRSSGDLAAGLTQLRDLLLGVSDMLVVLTEGAIKFFISAGPGLTTFFATITDILSNVDWAGLGESFGGLMERLGEAIKNIPPESWQGIADGIGAMVQQFLKFVESGGLESIINGFVQFAEIINGITAVIQGLDEGIRTVSDTLNGAADSIHDNFVQPIYDAIGGLFEWLGIGSPARKLVEVGLAIIEGLLLGLAGGPAAVFAKVRELATKALEALADAGTLLIDKGRQWVEGAKRGIGDKLGEARAKAIEIKDNIKNALSDAGDWLFGTGVDVVTGFIRGISSKIADAARAAWDMAKAAWNAAQNAIIGHSPSRLFMSLGADTVRGYIIGLQEQIGPLLATVRDMLARVVQEAQSHRIEPLVQAEDGSFVPVSFYKPNTGGTRDVSTILAEARSRAREREERESLVAQMTAALGQVLNNAQLTARGEDLVLAYQQAAHRFERR